MRLMLMIAGAALLSTPAIGQTVKGGIDAWARGDYAGALAAWRPLAARGDADAMFNLGQAYRLGRGVPIDLGQAVDWYTRAANQGHVDAQTQLGILLFQNGNQLSAMRWLKSAADKGDARAELLYGTALFNGDGLVRRDPEAAYRYVASGAAQGLAAARTTLAEMDQTIPADVRRRAMAAVASPAKAAVKSVKRGPELRVISTPAKPVSPQTTPSLTGSWRIQLGAFGQRAAAEALFRKLAGGPLSGKQSFFVPVGAVTRLQAGPYASRAAASVACATLTARGQACFAVPAR
ncbi:MAG: SPOR domain-containing protein [Sphingomicrobium sp.]|nr:SPOR domain-containing protein [Sphingomonadales bacterium]